MCGLVGEVRHDGGRVNLAAIDRAAEVLAPRGPDDGGTWSEGPFALSSRRLSVVDLSPAGRQPMVDVDLGLTTVFNGCIYNHDDLRGTLAGLGYTFRSHSDTEVIAKAYAQWGIDCVRRFAGMFAFAIIEHDSGRVVLARDRLGVKPMYLDHTADRLRFASTLPALLAAGGVDTSLDRVALSHYLSFDSIVPPPRTILAGVRKLPPATVRVVEPDGVTSDTHYWEPMFTRMPERSDWSVEDWRDALLDSLRVAVRRRLVADVPVGALLSGGLDSALVVALMTEAGGPGLPTYSIGFPSAGGDVGDEFAYSDLVARQFDTEHHRIEVSSNRLFEALDPAVEAMSEPLMSPACLAFHLLGHEVSRSLKVVQGGQGADELLAGYRWHRPLADVSRAGAADAYADVFVDRTYAEMADLLERDWLLDHDAPRRFLADVFARPGATTGLDAVLRNDTTVMQVDDPIQRIDTMMMASGVEARMPFMDHDLVELAAAIPPDLKLAHGGKGVLKQAARGLVPAAVVDRPKGYFPVPGVKHLDAPFLQRVRAALTDPAAKQRGLFRPAVVEAWLADPDGNRTPIGSNALWQIGLLEIWLQTHGIR